MELLVSIAIFILLGILLVTLLSNGVGIWSRGEVRRDAYERAAILFDQFRADISCATIHREPEAAGYHPNFTCFPDPLGRPRFYFTRVGAAVNPVPTQVPKDPEDTVLFTPADPFARHEIFYVFDPDPAVHRLYRGQFAFNADPKMLPSKQWTDPNFVQNQCSLLMEGVLYLGFRFWSQDTDAWSPVQGEQGPEPRWDSTRFLDKAFALRRQNLLADDVLDDIVPHRVEVTVTLERPGATDLAASTLKSSVDSNTTSLPASLLPLFPEGPGFVRIDDEWIAYESRTSSGLSGLTRGARGTNAAAHEKGAALRWGDTFTTVIAVPGYKDDPNR
ncbi:MAG: hypothetical protein HYY18_13315 [Planctomycetes bacterium]|nr:hypothetical protein [Planctomycetota bacterium]